MSKLNTKVIIFINALLVSIIVLISYLILFYSNNIKGYTIALMAVFVFIFLIVTLNFSIRRFVLNKIIPLYKLIQKTNITENELKKDLIDKDPILEFTRDFDTWADERSSEVKQLTEMEKYRKEFVGNVAHELKTPLFNIQGYIYTLLDGGLEDENINRKYLERTDKSIDRLISIVKDLDTITRLETDQLELEFEDFNIIELVEDVFEMQELRAKKKNIKMEIINKPAQVLLVNADKKGIIQVITNLVVNSINYGKENGHVKISFSVFEQYIIVDVIDNGIGLDENEIPRIFERFYRTDKSRSREQGGTGLGLSIVKHILEAQNLTVNVRSQVNKGTSIAFTLNKASKL